MASIRLSRIRWRLIPRYSRTASDSESFGSRRGSVEPSSRITRRASTTRFLAPPEDGSDKTAGVTLSLPSKESLRCLCRCPDRNCEERAADPRLCRRRHRGGRHRRLAERLEARLDRGPSVRRRVAHPTHARDRVVAELATAANRSFRLAAPRLVRRGRGGGRADRLLLRARADDRFELRAALEQRGLVHDPLRIRVPRGARDTPGIPRPRRDRGRRVPGDDAASLRRRPVPGIPDRQRDARRRGGLLGDEQHRQRRPLAPHPDLPPPGGPADLRHRLLRGARPSQRRAPGGPVRHLARLAPPRRERGRHVLRPVLLCLPDDRGDADADSRALNVGWSTLKKALASTKQATLVPRPLTILEVTHMFGQIAEARGADSTRARRRLLESLLGRASEGERDVLLRNVFGEMRIGVNEGVMLEGIADAAGVEADSVRTAHMFLGDLGLVAEIALFEGAPGLRSRGLRLLAPMNPMLAEMAEDLDEVLREHGGQTAIEYKLDGARIQIHRRGNAVRIFSRRLSDVTDSLPEIVAIAKSLPAAEFLLEGEIVAVDTDGKPLPFQDLMRRFRRVHGIEAAQQEVPLKLSLFDLLHVEGRTLIDEPYQERWRLLEGLVPSEFLTARRIVKRKEEIEPFLQAALSAGHEGLMAKALDSTYSVGKRGKKWFKIKPADRDDKGPADVDTYARLKELYAKQFERKGRGPEDL